MRIFPRELPRADLPVPQREQELRAQLAAAHLEAHEARSRLIDVEWSLARCRYRAEAAEQTFGALTQQVTHWEHEARGLRHQLAQLQAEMNAIRSSRWVRLRDKLRAALRRIARPLPPRVKRVLRGVLRRIKHALPV